MSVIHIPAHLHGTGGATPVIVVDVDDDEAKYVNLDLSRLDGPYATLTPGEARALATALIHFAKEIER